jgi:hypothetical protein
MKIKISLCVIAIISAVCGFAYSACDLCINDLKVDGKLGVGTDTPTRTVQIISDSTGQLRFGASGNQELFVHDTARTVRLRIKTELASTGDAIIRLENENADVADIILYDNGEVELSRGSVAFITFTENHVEMGKNTLIEGDLRLDNAESTCIILRDTDNAGWTECNTLNGSLSCTVDSDGICDGS